ncbi:MAG: DUF493 family protein [Cyclobacteriaceae bacterium]
MSLSIQDFKKKLDEEHAFPEVYMFKFIVPSSAEQEVLDILPEGKTTSRASKQGTYISVTAELMMGTSDDVIAIYQKAHKIEGLIAL